MTGTNARQLLSITDTGTPPRLLVRSPEFSRTDHPKLERATAGTCYARRDECGRAGLTSEAPLASAEIRKSGAFSKYGAILRLARVVLIRVIDRSGEQTVVLPGLELEAILTYL